MDNVQVFLQKKLMKIDVNKLINMVVEFVRFLKPFVRVTASALTVDGVTSNVVLRVRSVAVDDCRAQVFFKKQA